VGYTKGGTITAVRQQEVYSNYVRVGGLVGLNENGNNHRKLCAGNVSAMTFLRGLAGSHSAVEHKRLLCCGNVTCMNDTKSAIAALWGEIPGQLQSPIAMHRSRVRRASYKAVCG
jgi:hypothetical protein